MIKSTKVERMAIIARLEEAFKTNRDPAIESVINFISDLNHFEDKFVQLHEKFEETIVECFRAQRSGHHPTYILSNIAHLHGNFLKEFEQTAECFSNHYDIQRNRRKTDSVIDSESRGRKRLDRKTITIVDKHSPFSIYVNNPIPGNNSYLKNGEYIWNKNSKKINQIW